MSQSFIDTLYFRDENLDEIISGIHKNLKLFQNIFLNSCEGLNLRFNEMLVLIEIKKGYTKKIEISERLFLKKQNVNEIFKSLVEKKFIEKVNNLFHLSKQGEDTLNVLNSRMKKRIVNLFGNVDPKNMQGFIQTIKEII